MPPTINRDAVEFVKKIKADSGYELVYLAGLMATKNDCYDPAAALSVLEAEQFHAAQAQQLASTGLEFLLAQTMPAVTEAEGMARAMIASGLPAVISFCINRDGRVLDGTPLDEAIDLLDDRLEGAPLGYAVNCSHPDFIMAEQMNPHALSRLIGIWANASAREHSELELSEETVADDLDTWADAMVTLHKTHGVKILGGCCGTTDRHLRAICQRVCS